VEKDGIMAAEKTITELNELTVVDQANDWMPVVDVSDTSASVYGTTKKAKASQFKGDTGNQGERGDTGVGTVGATGSSGQQGDTGVGEKGDTGVGAKGDTGVGVTGATGEDGEQGDTGIGAVGATGEDGLRGDTGIGEKGDTGNDGLQGDTGVGTTGATGIQGDTGIGEKGDTGVGTVGATGEDGDQGDTGVGTVGATGEQGDTGPDNVSTSTSTDITGYLYGDGDTLEGHTSSVVTRRFDVTDYGAVGDGNTDDSGAIQDAIDAANTAGGGEVFFPVGVYVIETELTSYENISMVGIPRLSIIDFSDTVIDFDAVNITGSIGSGEALDSNATKGDLELEVDTTDFSAGDYIELSDTEDVTGYPTYRGEICRIESIDDGDTMTIFGGLVDSYATADSAQIKKYTFKENISFFGLDFLGPEDDTLTITGIRINYAKHISIDNCHFTKCHYTGVFAKDSIYGKVTRCHFEDNRLSGLAYGIALLSTCQDWDITNNTGTNCKHHVTLGSNTSEAGICRRINVIGNTFFAGYGSAIDCHNNAQDCNFSNNTLHGGGILYRGTDGIISNNTITDVTVAENGISYKLGLSTPGNMIITGNSIRNIMVENGNAIDVEHTDGPATSLGITISNNTIDNVAYRGISVVDDSGNVLNRVKISGNIITNIPQDSNAIVLGGIEQFTVSDNQINLSNSGCTGIRCTTNTSSEGCALGSIVGNTITGSSSYGIRLVDADDITIIGNLADGMTYGFYQDSDCTYSKVAGNNFRNCTNEYSFSTGTGHEILDVPDVSFEAKTSATQTVSGTELLEAATEISDRGGAYDNSAGNYKFVAPYPGRYMFIAGAYFANLGADILAGVSIYRNGTLAKEVLFRGHTSTDDPARQCVAEMDLNKDDYVQAYVTEGATGDIDVSNSQSKTYFAGTLLKRYTKDPI